MKERQWYAAVCANGHIQSDTLETPITPGVDDGRDGAVPRVPKRCPTCSATVFVRCTNDGCDAPINGYVGRESAKGRRNTLYADWFCQRCGRPYLWATPEQVLAWLTNRVRFDDTLEEDDRLNLLALLPTAGSPTVDENSFDRLRQLSNRSPMLAADLRPFLPTLLPLFEK